MKQSKKLIFSGIGLWIMNLLTGCSGSNEDVQISNCKSLAAQFVSGTTSGQWALSATETPEPNPAIIKLVLDGQTTQVQCFYQHDQAEENVMGDINPLENYEFVPYKVVVDNKTYGLPEITKGMHAITGKQIDEAVETAEKNINKASEAVNDAVNKAVDKL